MAAFSYLKSESTAYDAFLVTSYVLEAIFLLDLILKIFKKHKNPFDIDSNVTEFSLRHGKETCVTFHGLKKYLFDHFWDIIAILPFQFLELPHSNEYIFLYIKLIRLKDGYRYFTKRFLFKAVKLIHKNYLKKQPPLHGLPLIAEKNADASCGNDQVLFLSFLLKTLELLFLIFVVTF